MPELRDDQCGKDNEEKSGDPRNDVQAAGEGLASNCDKRRTELTC
jgi:hypothetical protein